MRGALSDRCGLWKFPNGVEKHVLQALQQHNIVSTCLICAATEQVGKAGTLSTCVRISTGAAATLTEIFLRRPQSRQANFWIARRLGHDPSFQILPNSLFINHSTTRCYVFRTDSVLKQLTAITLLAQGTLGDALMEHFAEYC
jgi:hypothetical protein